MHKKFNKLSSLFLIFAIATSHSSIKPSYPTYTGNYPIELYVFGAATIACIMGKIGYELYLDYVCSTEKIIEHCRTTYADVYKDVERYYNNYKSDAQLSDWDLKEYIIYTDNPYQFIAYHKQIMVAIFQLIKHYKTVTDEIKIITNQKKRVSRNTPQSTILIAQELKQLKIRGRMLQEYITKTLHLLSTLKNRIISFKEYNDNCHNWSYGREKKHCGFQ